MNKILFIGKKGDHFSEVAAQFTQELFSEATVVMSHRADAIPEICHSWRGDYVFSYLSQWIIPQEILDNASIAAINWHPGSNNYPGIGCTNFAIYEGADTFGITCHHMLSKVDTGSIIEVKTFPVLPDETVLSLTLKCYNTILASYIDVVSRISKGDAIPKSDLTWTRKPFTRKQLNALCKLSLDMEKDEIDLRIRSTKYDRHWAYYEIYGKKYFHE